MILPRFAALACTLFLCTEAHALVIAGGETPANTTAPADDFGFANVGRLFDTADGFFTSCVYLQDGWVLSAYHPVRADGGGFAFGPVIFKDPSMQDAAFQVNSSSAVRLKNSNGSFTDLALFQLTSIPTFLQPVTVAASTPSPGASVVLAGNGLGGEPEVTRWDSDWNEVTQGPFARSGYQSSGVQAIRWGTNMLDAGSTPFTATSSLDAGYGTFTALKTDFDNTPGEAQAMVGDSGGGLFYKNGTRWELLGTLVTTDEFPGQPDNTAVFGNHTYAVNLPTYRSQILAVVPEPGTAVSIILGAAALLGGRRFRCGRSPRE